MHIARIINYYLHKTRIVSCAKSATLELTYKGLELCPMLIWHIIMHKTQIV